MLPIGPIPSFFALLSRSLSLFIYLFIFLLLRAAPAAYGSQARGQIRAVAASLCHSHNNAGSKLHLQPIPQLMAMPDLQPTE